MTADTKPAGPMGLKGCPFCGDAPKIYEPRSAATNHNQRRVICCGNDDCFGPATTAEGFSDAVIQWNTRALPAEAGAIRESVREASPDVLREARELVSEEMVTAAMRAFEQMSAVLRYREKDKWHACDVMGMRDAIAAALAFSPPAEPIAWGRIVDGVVVTVRRHPAEASDMPLYTTPAAKPQPATVTADALALDLYYSDPENEGFEPDVQSADYREKYLRFANVFMSRLTIARKDDGR